ncbi:hypothetical protein GG344DRAFT_69498 [Lentinula edodes]|nr:hypothetical protein GG344DRAFT_69498 [Lentinula edodes]
MRPTTQLILVFALVFTACAAPLAVKRIIFMNFNFNFSNAIAVIKVRDQAFEIRAPSSHVDITVTFEGNPEKDNESFSKAYTNAIKKDVRALLKNVAARDLGAPAGEALLFHWVGVPTHDSTKPVMYDVMWNEVGPYKVVMSHKTPMKDAIVKNARGGIVRNDGDPYKNPYLALDQDGPRMAPGIFHAIILPRKFHVPEKALTIFRDTNSGRYYGWRSSCIYRHPWSGVFGVGTVISPVAQLAIFLVNSHHTIVWPDGNFIGTPAICGAIGVYKSLPLRSQAGAEAIESITTKGRAGTDPVPVLPVKSVRPFLLGDAGREGSSAPKRGWVYCWGSNAQMWARERLPEFV